MSPSTKSSGAGLFQAQTTTIAPALREQLVELNVQASALRATQSGLVRQLNNMRQDNPARPDVQRASADVGSELARVEGKIAEAQARLAQAEGVPVGQISPTGILMPPPPPGGFNRGPDPDMVVGMSFVLAMCLVLPLSIAFARRLWRRQPAPPSADRFDEVMQRLGRLEVGMDSIAIEVERVGEGQRFVTKIFAERPGQVMQAEGQPQAGLNEGQPLRALGAGPVEAIRVKEAEAAKQRVNER
jgi:hypothetical protein